jgi:hypothetical protein
VFAVDGLFQVGRGVPDPGEELEMVLGVLPFVRRGLFENFGDAMAPLLPRGLGEEGVLVSRLGLAGERCLDISPSLI